MRKSINEKYILLQSHLTRGAWIEIFNEVDTPVKTGVAPHTRCVD